MSHIFRCNECEFWEPIPAKVGVPTDGLCRMGLAVIDQNDSDYRGRWPLVYLDDWCGPGLVHHQRKVAAEEAALAERIREE